MTLKPIPDGYHAVTPYLVVRDVAGLIDFLRQVFDATQIERLQTPDGRIMHAEVRIGDSVVMMSEASDDNTPAPPGNSFDGTSDVLTSAAEFDIIALDDVLTPKTL
jgi:uncharacterized glyoxalase superfamily protein PhnB